MGCGIGKSKQENLNKSVDKRKEYPLLWLCHKENYILEIPITNYNPNSQVAQYNVVLNGIVFQVINPIEDLDSCLRDSVNDEIQ